LPRTEVERILREGRGVKPTAGEVGAHWNTGGW
jgi:hypothetical protein